MPPSRVAVADRHDERHDVRGHAGEAADEGMRADAGPLLDRGEAAEDGVVADLGMAAERRLVGQDDMVADQAVMGDVGADHQEAAGADRWSSRGPRAVPRWIVACSRMMQSGPMTMAVSSPL